MKRISWIVLAGLIAACGDDGTVQEDTTVDDTFEQDISIEDDTSLDDATPLDVQADVTSPDSTEDVFNGETLLLGVDATESWAFESLSDPVHVIRTSGNVPHIYGSNREDVSYVMGFVMARDRYLMMDLARRLGRGTISELFGRDGLAIDQESRGSGITYVAQRVADRFAGEGEAHVSAFCEGINAYIDAVKEGTAVAPSELTLAAGLLGAENPEDLMKPFEPIDVAAILAYILYESSYETGDIGFAAAMQQLDGLFDDVAFSDLRKAGLEGDILGDITPALSNSSAEGPGLTQTPGDPVLPQLPPAAGLGQKDKESILDRIPAQFLRETVKKLEHPRWRWLRAEGEEFGSNTWAVSGDKTADGSTLVAGDGHLALAIPSILFQIGLDTSVLGGRNLHQLGLLIPGFPLMNIGTNGKVGWSQTQVAEDITDWYAEELQLDSSGKPSHALFQGEWVPLLKTEETYTVADIPVLSSVGGVEVWERWTTEDGRWITSIEGRAPQEGEELADGESIVSVMGDLWIPGDQDGDGVISAISFDYVGLDSGDMLTVVDGFGHSNDIFEFREWTKGLTAYSQNFAVADTSGNIFYTGYQAIPCRGHLPRNPDGTFAEGASPIELIDGTQYGGFTIPLKDNDTKVDESLGEGDASLCVVPFDFIPQAINPPEGFVQNANNDPGNLSTDNSVTNDEYYLGGPWNNGYRGDTIQRELVKAVQDGDATIEDMANIQGNHESRLGQSFVFFIETAITRAGEAADDMDGLADPATIRLAELYLEAPTALDEVKARLEAWEEAGCQAESGVETFYHAPTELEREDAVATMIFNAWLPRFINGVFQDESIPGVWRPKGSRGQVRTILRFLAGRGDENSKGIASWNEDTGESIFFDVLGTPELELSDEIIVGAMLEALTYLEGPGEGPGNGGFETAEMDAWLWGLRHQVRFESLLLDFLGDNEALAILAEPFSITTSVLPLAESLEDGDPRKGLKWFPRPGDNWGVDAANPGFSGTSFTHASGPVMRMVFQLADGKVTGQNIIPGGQSAIVDSPYFADQAALWLGNQTSPALFHVEDVVEGAIGREEYLPTAP